MSAKREFSGTNAFRRKFIWTRLVQRKGPPFRKITYLIDPLSLRDKKMYSS